MPDLTTPIRYLSGSEVGALLPGIAEQLELVRVAYRALVGGRCEMPATPGLAPRPRAIAHALPAYVADGDITALKWVCEFSGNRAAYGLPNVAAVIVVNDSVTGLPIGILDGSQITAARTAAASAVCVDSFAREGWSRVGIIGHGIQSEAHIEALAALNSEAAFDVFSRRELDPGPRGLRAVPDTRSAARDADVLITGSPLGAKIEQPVAFDALTPSALVLPLDDDASLDADVANRASTFLVDSADDFALRRQEGIFSGWREPDATVAEAVLEGRDVDGVTVCANQGIGALDAVFARAVLAAAERDGVGVLLDR